MKKLANTKGEFNHMDKYKSPYYFTQSKMSTKPSKLIQSIVPGYYGFYNQQFAQDSSLPAAVILSELLVLDEYYQDRLITHNKYGSGWFCASVEFLQKRTSILRREQSNCINKLLELKFIDVAVFGIPALRHIRVNKEAIKEHFEIKKKEL